MSDRDTLRTMFQSGWFVIAAALCGGCLYIEGGGAVYGGSGGVSAGWSVAGGVYGDFGSAKLSTGGGGSIVYDGGHRYAGAGIHGKADVTIKQDGGSGGAVMWRGTVAGAFTNDEDPDTTDTDHPGWNVFLGGTLGFRKHDGETVFSSEVVSAWASLGLDVVGSDGNAFFGPSLRAGVGTNVARMVPMIGF